MILHDSRSNVYRKPFGAVEINTDIKISIDVNEPAPQSVRLMVWRDEELSPRYYNMAKDPSEEGRYTAGFTAPEEGCLLWYAFEVEFENDDEERSVIYYGNNHEALGGRGDTYEYSPECYQITVYKPSKVPEWYKNGIVYQIFPDRFARDAKWRERTEAANGRVNERRGDMRRVIQEDWTRPAYYVRNDQGRVVEWPMYGGSLKGIEEKLDYIRSLGVTCIYLNPVFEASTNHRYDTGDYMRIDPALGTDEDFVSLAEAAREKGIRIILDGVFSHTGADSRYFDKYGNYAMMHPEDGAAENGAWNDPDSPYRSWFKFDENEASGYKSWWGVDDLPEVNENDSSFRSFILGSGGVVEHWLKKGASGWRLDVADELPDDFIAGVRKTIKKTDPDGLLLGEVWEDASNKVSYGERRRYFLGDELDATMHYPLRDILLDYINYTIGAADAADRLMSIAENYPPENWYGTLNIIGSHDRERIITMMAAEEDYPSATLKVKLLSTLQYCLPGVPAVYYGDEVGLMGGSDPANRNGYPWGFENRDLGYHYRMLGLIYDEHPSLRGGGFELLSGNSGLSDDIFAFTRSGYDAAGNAETILVLASRSYSAMEADLSGLEFSIRDESGDCRPVYALELLTSTEIPVDDEGRLGIISMEKLSVRVICLRAQKPVTEDIGRSAGVICHVSSIPGGRLGSAARDFVDYIASAGFSIWQVLPLNPAGMGDSPYSSYAAFAGDPRFIDKDELPAADGFDEFVNSNAYWLRDYMAYTVLKEANGLKPWYEWSEKDKFADAADVLDSLSDEQKERARQIAEEQYWFCCQWTDLKKYANSKGVRIMGDLPMFMAADSADVWANKDIFRMDDKGIQKVHAGVPPDAFSGEGQDWGNPLYDWDLLKSKDYDWWIRRIRQCAERFDILRIDHFRGLSEYYAIPEGGTPKEGSWQHSAGLAFFAAIHRMLKEEGLGLKLLAEDLGFLDAGCKNLLKLSGLPGMDIWQFTSAEMKEMSEKEPVKAATRAFYTGTHDNDTLAGWLAGTGREAEAPEIIKRIYESAAVLAMMQLQDVFLLGSKARMNVPGKSEGNWTWKVHGSSIYEAFPDAEERAKWLRELAVRTGRVNG